MASSRLFESSCTILIGSAGLTGVADGLASASPGNDVEAGTFGMVSGSRGGAIPAFEAAVCDGIGWLSADAGVKLLGAGATGGAVTGDVLTGDGGRVALSPPVSAVCTSSGGTKKSGSGTSVGELGMPAFGGVTC